MLGDTATGRCWLDEHDVVGHIGRSTGSLKVPLLIEPGEDGGAAILTDCLLRLIAWESGRDLYRHPAYRVPGLAIQRAPEQTDLPWQVLHDGTVVACFAEIGKAGGYLAFMCGETVGHGFFSENRGSVFLPAEPASGSARTRPAGAIAAASPRRHRDR